ncbi:hypothetical protein EC912_102436 [Luteibacter rhizovicinus]|uniref:HutD protein n=1 Tax=Luteibacter rhizovicinus TaxID=242606 RepID=A0A4R3YT42_9GAMM|nr:HutD family protein [Luteibacter rhizovicinus]TCV96087.1 hypothetical protein EC912_102436 [Luteibacter rhizovicinus]
MTTIRATDLIAVPWKNGMGVTRVVATEPADAGMDDFLWRASVADVDTASPFSAFPGVDRTIVLLEGAGFVMTLNGERTHALTTPCDPFAFEGEATVDIELAGDATRDFNLMVRRGLASGKVDVLRASARLGDDVALVYLAGGGASIAGTTLAVGDAYRPDSGDCLELNEHAVALVVRIDAGRVE